MMKKQLPINQPTHFFMLLFCALSLAACSKKEKTPVDDHQEGQTNWKKYAYLDIGEVNTTHDHFYATMTDIEFVTENRGYMIGGIQYHEISPAMFITLDGGLTWTRNYEVNSCGMSSIFYSLIFGKNSKAFASTRCGGPEYNMSVDNGLTWPTNSWSQFSNDVPNGDFKLNDTILFLSSIRSIDGGSNWEQLSFPANTTDYYFSNPQYGVCVTSTGQISISTDLGNTWQIVYDNPAKVFNTVSMPSSNSIIAAGNCIISGDGTTWSETSSKNNIFDVTFFNDQIGFAAICNDEPITNATGEILKTKDGGQTWTVNYHSGFMGFLKVKIVNEWNVFASGLQRDHKIGKCYYLKTTTLGE